MAAVGLAEVAVAVLVGFGWWSERRIGGQRCLFQCRVLWLVDSGDFSFDFGRGRIFLIYNNNTRQSTCEIKSCQVNHMFSTGACFLMSAEAHCLCGASEGIQCGGIVAARRDGEGDLMDCESTYLILTRSCAWVLLIRTS